MVHFDVLSQGTETLLYKRGRVLVVGFWSEHVVRGAHANQKVGLCLVALKCFDAIVAMLYMELAFYFGPVTVGFIKNMKNHRGFPSVF